MAQSPKKASFVKADANKKYGPSKHVHLPRVGVCVDDPKATDSKQFNRNHQVYNGRLVIAMKMTFLQPSSWVFTCS